MQAVVVGSIYSEDEGVYVGQGGLSQYRYVNTLWVRAYRNRGLASQVSMRTKFFTTFRGWTIITGRAALWINTDECLYI